LYFCSILLLHNYGHIFKRKVAFGGETFQLRSPRTRPNQAKVAIS